MRVFIIACVLGLALSVYAKNQIFIKTSLDSWTTTLVSTKTSTHTSVIITATRTETVVVTETTVSSTTASGVDTNTVTTTVASVSDSATPTQGADFTAQCNAFKQKCATVSCPDRQYTADCGQSLFTCVCGAPIGWAQTTGDAPRMTMVPMVLGVSLSMSLIGIVLGSWFIALANH